MIEFPVVLVINCGSSSVKFSVLDASSCDALMTQALPTVSTLKKRYFREQGWASHTGSP